MTAYALLPPPEIITLAPKPTVRQRTVGTNRVKYLVVDYKLSCLAKLVKDASLVITQTQCFLQSNSPDSILLPRSVEVSVS